MNYLELMAAELEVLAAQREAEEIDDLAIITALVEGWKWI